MKQSRRLKDRYSMMQKPSMRDSRPAQSLAKARLQEMGSMTRNEFVMAAACVSTITLWVLGGLLGKSEAET